MDMELVQSRWQADIRRTCDTAQCSRIEDRTPITLWEVVVRICHSLILSALNGQLKSRSEHYIVSLVLIGLRIHWEIEEQGSIESTTFLVKHR